MFEIDNSVVNANLVPASSTAQTAGSSPVATTPTIGTTQVVQTTKPGVSSPLSHRLEELQMLKEKQILTNAEYESKRKAIIAEY